jgi:uncharacterized membrane protein
MFKPGWLLWRRVEKRRMLLGLIFSAGISLLAYRRHSLNRSGVLGAIITGTTTFGLGGWAWGLALIYFFVSSSVLSHFREQDKVQTVADKFSKGSERDLGQVAANGGAATLLALAYGLTSPGRGKPCPYASPGVGAPLAGALWLRRSLQAAYVGVLATATADTWATEVGVLSSHQPRLITSGKRITPGTSGGITLLGTATGALGALSLGTVFWLLQRCRSSLISLPIIGLVSGLAGSIFDSLLGATLQAMYYCPVCDKETERGIHSCGTKTIPLRGLPWLNNDVVNFIATLWGGLIALALHLFIRNDGSTH